MEILCNNFYRKSPFHFKAISRLKGEWFCHWRDKELSWKSLLWTLSAYLKDMCISSIGLSDKHLVKWNAMVKVFFYRMPIFILRFLYRYSKFGGIYLVDSFIEFNIENRNLFAKNTRMKYGLTWFIAKLGV